jgi:hypothetical protein
MNGYGLAAVVVASVAAVVVALLWAVVRVGQRSASDQAAVSDETPAELSDGEALTAPHAERGRLEMRRRVAEAAERSRRGQDCE